MTTDEWKGLGKHVNLGEAQFKFYFSLSIAYVSIEIYLVVYLYV